MCCNTGGRTIIDKDIMIKDKLFDIISDRLVDDMSRVYFEARKDFLTDPRISHFYEKIHSLQINYTIRDIEVFCKNVETKGWIVWGSDDIALYHYRLLSDSAYPVLGICGGDNLAHEADIPLIGMKECIQLVNNGNCTLLCGSKERYRKNSLLELLDTHRVLVVENHLVGRCGRQYFDFFKANGEESFLDGGSLDGKTSMDFLKWCNGNYNEIYAFEPNPKVADLCKRRLQYVERCTFYEKALWSEDGTIWFDNYNKGKWDACISSSGNISVECVSIDSIMKEKHISFIKLDVEGAELEVLHGAKECIIKNKPRMAISVYHHAEDLFLIADFLMKLDSAYKFAIRHYHSDTIETVLYVFEG